jgi:hypothetical protein
VRTFWSRADSSVPITQIAVMTTMTAQASAVTAIFRVGRAVGADQQEEVAGAHVRE